MKNFCPKCGKEEGTFIKGFCRDCFLDDHKLVEIPRRIEVKFCPKCRKVLVSGNWIEQTQGVIERIVERKIRLFDISKPVIRTTLKQEDDGTTTALISVEGLIDNEKIEVGAQTKIVAKKEICQECSRISGGYFEAIVQIRQKPDSKKTKKDFSNALEELKRFLVESNHGPIASVAKIEKQKNGIDAYIGSKKGALIASKKMARVHNSEVTESFKLFGKKDGRSTKRFTYCVRI